MTISQTWFRKLTQTSGFPVERTRTNDDLPTLGAPTRQSVGFSGSTTGMARKAY